MARPEEYRVFLASSNELAEDRQAFAEMIRRRSDDWVAKGVHLRLVVWEDFIDAMSRTRLQDEYNRALKGCDIFVMLFFTKVGRHTEEEFDTAFSHFQANGRPLVYTYFKSAPVDPDAIDGADLDSLKAFQSRLRALGHFQTRYENVAALQLHFWQQLDKLVANGFVRFPAAEPAPAVGAGAVLVMGDNHGSINTGIQMQGPRTRPEG